MAEGSCFKLWGQEGKGLGWVSSSSRLHWRGQDALAKKANCEIEGKFT